MDDRDTRRSFRFPAEFIAFDRAWLARSIPARFEHQVRLRPDSAAVRFGLAELSYAQLNAAANRAARFLLTTTPDGPAPVALMLDQGVPLVVWILAILKAGLAYVPLDTRLPAQVLARMLDDLEPRLMIAGAKHRARADSLAAGRFPVIADELPSKANTQLDSHDLELAIDAGALAYIFYTSGSTGTPKGVADSHRNVLHNVMRYTNSLGFAASDRMSLIQNPSFSGTVSSLFGALLNGATSVLREQETAGAGAIGAWLRAERISVFHGVPAIFRQIAPCVERYPDLRLIRLEGDRAAAADLARFQGRFDPACVLVNGLGATECGLVRQYFAGMQTPRPHDGALPIGFTVPDMRIQVVDDEDRPVQAGEIGEIVVESRFLALGYWRNPALTAGRFQLLRDGLRRYRTGDLGKLDHDGCLTHLGRRDQQPRIAGRFVDTGEIERVLHEVPGIRHAVLQTRTNDAGEDRLVAYLVADATGVRRPAIDEVRRHVEASVAAAMVPAAFVFLDELPVTADGKLDRRRLPAPSRARPPLAVPFAPVANDAQAELSRIWSEVLEMEDPGIDDPFLELGGDSLSAARIVARVVESKIPGFSDAALVDLFEHRTIRALAAALVARSRAGVSDTETGESAAARTAT